jgi:arsenite methyltransferase
LEKLNRSEIKEAVKNYYAGRAREHESAGHELDAACSGCAPQGDVQTSCCSGAETLLERAVEGAESLGCGDVLPFTEIEVGDVVLDLGCGMGLEVIQAAQRVGPTGKVIGLDMTPEMIGRASRNAERAGVHEVTEFRLGEIENMPVDDESVDWIISNCVINLSADKERVFREAFRVLKPSGRLVVSDLVSTGLPDEMRRDLASWAQCLGGTIEESEYLALIRKAGFEEVAVLERIDATPMLPGTSCCSPSSAGDTGPRVASIRVKASKAGDN